MSVPGATVSVVVPTHNRRDKLIRLLRDLEHQDGLHSGHGDYEVIVVDDGSTDGTETAVRALRTGYPLRYRRQEPRGPAAARNAGIRIAGGEYVVLLDDDMRVGAGLIRAHMAAHARCEGAVVIGPGWLPEGLPLTPFARYRTWLDRQSRPAAALSSAVRVHSLSSANTSARRALLMQVGLYCEQLSLPGAEEAELTWRLARRGIPIVYDGSIPACQDDTPVTFHGYCAKHERYGMAGAEVVRKLPQVAGELGSLRALVAVNGLLAYGTDTLPSAARKTLKALLSQRACLALLNGLVAVLERAAPLPVVLWPLYRLVIGLHIYRGFRRGLAAAAVRKGGRSAILSAG